MHDVIFSYCYYIIKFSKSLKINKVEFIEFNETKQIFLSPYECKYTKYNMSNMIFFFCKHE